MDKTSIGNRMKAYERVTKQKLMRRSAVIIRLDGKAFHTWTKCLAFDTLKSPYSNVMHTAMRSTAYQLVQSIQNASFTYTQSDEISILLNDWKTLKTEQWFDANIQKMVSISASMATGFFNHKINSMDVDGNMAFFDARVFNVPMDEVANYFVWRQQDATRNSINMLGQFYFSHKELQGKNTDEVQEMLFSKHGVNWNNILAWKKRGYCSTKSCMDDEIPMFTKEREYIECHLKEKNDD